MSDIKQHSSLIKKFESFDKQVKSNGLVLLDFYADWCGPCKQLTSHLEVLGSAVSALKIYKVDVDVQIDFAATHKIRAMPTLLLFKDGIEIGRKVGFAPAAELEAWIKSCIS